MAYVLTVLFTDDTCTAGMGQNTGQARRLCVSHEVGSADKHY